MIVPKSKNEQNAVLLPLREVATTGWMSGYRRFWRGCDWAPFLLPCTGGFAVARLAPACQQGTSQLMDHPGSYELALVKNSSSKRYKVYIGQSGSIRRRFHQDYRGIQGSHLKPFFDEALKNGCQIWRRCRYTDTAEEARKAEAHFLKEYDYAWNSRQAGCEARHINIVMKHNCFSRPTHLVCKPAKSAVHVEASASSQPAPASGRRKWVSAP